MPFAPKIRKDILAALDDYIIPALRRDVVTQLIAEPPFDFGDVEHRVLQKAFLVDKEFAPFQTILDWKRQRLIAVRFLRFMVVFEGVCIERVGITRAMARQLKMAGRRATGGIIELTLRAPAVLCHPAFTLNSSGAPQPRPFAQLGRAIYCNIFKDGIRVSLNVRSPQEASVTHHLQIEDAELAQMAHLYVSELRVGGSESAQALQLAFMLRLHRYLSQHRAFVSNSCWVTPPDINPAAAKVLSPANMQLCQQLTEYIVNHLHASLTLSEMAQHFHVSSVHLNHIFKQAQGTTVMNFVTQMRIEAAKTIIADATEPFGDVAQLVGFQNYVSFSNAFARATGMSPRRYRQQHQNGEK